ELIELAMFAHLYKRLYAASVQLRERAFRTKAELGAAGRGHNYNAACDLALAGCGQGEDASTDDRERARWRGQALERLRAELGVWSKLAESGPPAVRPALVRELQHWRGDPDLASVRDPNALARLPEDERQSWQRLWADVAALLKEAGKH